MQKRLQWIGLLFLCTVCLRIAALFLFPEASGFQAATLSAMIAMLAILFVALAVCGAILLIRWLKKRCRGG